MAAVPLPEGYHSVNPYIVVDDAARLPGERAFLYAGLDE